MYPLATASQEAESSRKLTHLLNAVTDALVWVIAKSGISSQQQSVRLANLLMLLSHVRHIRYEPLPELLQCAGVRSELRKPNASLQWLWQNVQLQRKHVISACTCTEAWCIVGVEMSATWHLVGFLWPLVGPTWMQCLELVSGILKWTVLPLK